MNKSNDDQLQEFQDFVAEFFPLEDVERLKTLCQKGSDGLLGYDHIDILGALAGFELGDPILDKLRLPYIFLSSHYLLLDDVIDHHLLQQNDALYSTHLLFLAYSQIFLSFRNKDHEQSQSKTLKRIAKRIFENANAIRQETKQRIGFYESNKDENYQMIVGRSNSTIQFYEILCFFAEKDPNDTVIRLLMDLVYYLQLGDDLGDWKQDYERNNFTPLIQECFNQLSIEKRGDFSSVEAVLYTGGVYERYVAQIVNNLEKIKTHFLEIEGVNAHPICSWIDGAKSKAHYLLTNMISKKMAFLSQL